MFIQIISNPLVQNALLAIVLISVASGLIGSYIHIRKISSISGGISHAVLGGLGVAVYFNIDPIVGALSAALVLALFIGMVKLRFRQHEDTVINAIWAIGMSVGIIFLYFSPQYQQNLVNFLFGKIYYISHAQLWRMLAIDLLSAAVFFLFYRQIWAASFDEEYASIRGLPIRGLYLLLLVLVAFTIVVLVQAVGLILVIALLTLPSAMARTFSARPHFIILFSFLIALILGTGGLLLSFPLQIPSSAVIIISMGVAYLASLLFRSIKK